MPSGENFVIAKSLFSFMLISGIEKLPSSLQRREFGCRHTLPYQLEFGICIGFVFGSFAVVPYLFIFQAQQYADTDIQNNKRTANRSFVELHVQSLLYSILICFEKMSP